MFDLIAVHQNGRECTLFSGSAYPFIHSADGLFFSHSLSQREFERALGKIKVVECIDLSECDAENLTQLCCFQPDGKMNFIEIDHTLGTFEILQGKQSEKAVGYSKYGAPIYSARLSPILFEMMIAELKGSKFKEGGFEK